MLRRPKLLKNEIVTNKEEEEGCNFVSDSINVKYSYHVAVRHIKFNS
jgi:hypothetical protein